MKPLYLHPANEIVITYTCKHCGNTCSATPEELHVIGGPVCCNCDQDMPPSPPNNQDLYADYTPIKNIIQDTTELLSTLAEENNHLLADPHYLYLWNLLLSMIPPYPKPPKPPKTPAEQDDEDPYAYYGSDSYETDTGTPTPS